MYPLRALAAFAVLLVAPLAACDNPETAIHYAPKQARADRATVLHGVTFPPFGGEIPPGEQQKLTAFARGLRVEGTSVSLLTSPAGTLQAQRAAAVRRQLQALGVPVASVAPSAGLAVDADTVVVSVESFSARAQNCSDWSKPSGYDPLNQPHSNLGCANARNIADMIENPRDLEMGRTPGPASGTLGAAAVDRLYSDKAKNPPTTQLGIGTSGSSSGSP